jgi:hypothetical protein
MALSVYFGDKLPAGNNISVTITADAQPEAVVSLAGQALDVFLRMIDENKKKYKLRFRLPPTATGEVLVKVKAGADSFEESRPIEALSDSAA